MSDAPSPPELTTGLATEAGARVLRVQGEVDLLTAGEFARALAEALDGGDGLTVDLRDVAFMDSTGLRALLEARRRSADRGGTIRLHVAQGGAVARLLELASVNGLFSIEGGPAAGA